MTATVVPTAPRGSLFFGHLPEFARDPLAFLDRTAREHGPMARLRFGRSHAFLVCDPDLIEEVLVSRREAFIKAKPLRALHRLFGNGLLTNEGESWRRQRRLAQPAFQPATLHTHASVVSSRAAGTFDTWRDGDTFDLHEQMKVLLMSIVAESLFGADVAERAAEIGRALESTMDRYASRRGAARFAPDWVPLGDTRRYLAGVHELERFVSGVVAFRRESGVEQRDLLGMLLTARDDSGSAMNESQLRDEAITLFVGGFDTPALALSWTWYLLSLHQECARKLADEVDAVVNGRALGMKDLAALPYAQSVIKESMRLYPPAWLLSREAIEDTSIGGCRVAKGTTVMMSPWVTHRDERFFDNPLRFDPDRWATGRTGNLPRFAYFPFGGGPRVCIGAAFAMMETTIILAMLSQRFEFRMIDGRDIAPRASMTLRPLNGIPAVVVRR